MRSFIVRLDARGDYVDQALAEPSFNRGYHAALGAPAGANWQGRAVNELALPRSPADRQVEEALYVAAIKPNRVEIRPRSGGEALVAWARDSSLQYGETCVDAFFVGSNAQSLAAIIEPALWRSAGGGELSWSTRLQAIDAS